MSKLWLATPDQQLASSSRAFLACRRLARQKLVFRTFAETLLLAALAAVEQGIFVLPEKLIVVTEPLCDRLKTTPLLGFENLPCSRFWVRIGERRTTCPKKCLAKPLAATLFALATAAHQFIGSVRAIPKKQFI